MRAAGSRDPSEIKSLLHEALLLATQAVVCSEPALAELSTVTVRPPLLQPATQLAAEAQLCLAETQLRIAQHAHQNPRLYSSRPLPPPFPETSNVGRALVERFVDAAAAEPEVEDEMGLAQKSLIAATAARALCLPSLTQQQTAAATAAGGAAQMVVSGSAPSAHPLLLLSEQMMARCLAFLALQSGQLDAAWAAPQELLAGRLSPPQRQQRPQPETRPPLHQRSL